MSNVVTQHGLSFILLALRKAADVYYGVSCAYYFGVTRADRSNAVRSLRSVLDPARPGQRLPRPYYRLARKAQRARIASPTRRVMQALFRAVASPEKIIWIRPAHLTHKTRNDLSLFHNRDLHHLDRVGVQ